LYIIVLARTLFEWKYIEKGEEVNSRDIYYETGNLARLPAQLVGPWGTNEVKYWTMNLYYAAKAGKKSLV
jgi:hypothetical protein